MKWVDLCWNVGRFLENLQDCSFYDAMNLHILFLQLMIFSAGPFNVYYFHGLMAQCYHSNFVSARNIAFDSSLGHLSMEWVSLRLCQRLYQSNHQCSPRSPQPNEQVTVIEVLMSSYACSCKALVDNSVVDISYPSRALKDPSAPCNWLVTLLRYDCWIRRSKNPFLFTLSQVWSNVG